MDDPKDVSVGDDPKVKLMADKDGETIEMKNIGSESDAKTEETLQPEEIKSGPELPLIPGGKEKFDYSELDPNEKEEGINEEAICNLLKDNSNKVVPMLKDTLILTERFTDGATILHLAARHAGKELMHSILENRGDLDFPELIDEEYNILNCAVDENNENSVVVILEWINKLKAENEEIGEMMNAECGPDYNTPLHQAYKNKSYKIMYELVKAGADPSRTNDFVFHTLHYAAADNNMEAVQAVLDGARDGGDETEAKLQQAREATDFNELLAGMSTENEQMIKLLMHDVDLANESFLDEHGSMLHYACDQNRVNLSKFLIEKAVPLNTENPLKQIPLSIATHRGYDAICIALLEAGADPNQILSDNKLCALNYAAKYGRIRLVKELVKYGAIANRTDISEPIIHSAVSGGNFEVTKFLLEECDCKATTEHEVNNITKKPLCIVIENGFVPLIKLLLDNGASTAERVSSFDNLRPVHVAIKSGQRQALQILLENGANPDDKTQSGASPAQLTMTDEKDAANILSLLITYGISFTKKDALGNMLIHTIAVEGAVRCADFFMEYLFNNHFEKIIGLVFEEKGLRDETALDKAINQKSEGVLKVFFKCITDVEEMYLRQHPTIFHKLLENELFEALKCLMDCHVYERFRDVEIQPMFLDSIDSKKDFYPDSPKYNHFEPSFLHKLLDCPDPLVKYHPMVSIVVREKLRFYRWWYVFTFLLYSIFLSALYYALIQASYICDGMLLRYDDNLSKGRAFCEVVVLVYALFFSIDEIIEFVGHWYQHHRERKALETEKEEEVEIFGEVEKGEGRLFKIKKYFKITRYLKQFDQHVFHFFSSFLNHFDAINIIDNLALLSLLILIILRLSQVAAQWTSASFTIILFSLKLFKYTRIFPSLGAYVRSIINIFKQDITQFGIIIIIFLLAYFGGIHLAARQAIVNPGPSRSLTTGESCGNQSYSELFWFDQERTDTYDLRRPLLTGIIFLLDGGPGNEEGSLLGSNFLFSFLYLAFAFAIIVVMSNILIAQLSDTYGEVIKTSGFHYNIELIATIEFRTNLAFFFGRKLRLLTSIEKLVLKLIKWNHLKDASPSKDIDSQIEESHAGIKKNAKELEDAKLLATNRHEWVQDKITAMGQTIEKNNETLEMRMGQLEEKLNNIINLLQPTT